MLRSVYTPGEINKEARLHLEAGFSDIWVEAEISNLSRPASGHLYFSLKDDKAQLRCALFRSHVSSLGFRPADGMAVQVHGRLSLYEPRGDYQLIADRMEQAGEGRLRAAFEALKKKLAAEGLFDPQHKQALPRYPRKIAVITSPSGAVIRDIIQVTGRRWPLARIRLYPVAVQGSEAPAALLRALRAVTAHGWAETVIIGRGGGSLEDLWAFNDEAVARAVFACPVPVISAVGHETDFAMTDFVADLRAPTPSAAAELLTPDGIALAQSLATGHARLQRAMQHHLARLAQQSDHLARRLLSNHPGRRLADNRLRLQRAREQLTAAARRGLGQCRLSLQGLARTLHAVSPLPTLERGYAVATDLASGAVLTSVRDRQPGDQVAIQLLDGQLHTEVKKVLDAPLLPPADPEDA